MCKLFHSKLSEGQAGTVCDWQVVAVVQGLAEPVRLGFMGGEDLKSQISVKLINLKTKGVGGELAVQIVRHKE